MAEVNNTFRSNIKAFWEFANGWIKSSVKNSTVTFCNGSDNSFLAVWTRSNYLNHTMKSKVLSWICNWSMSHGRKKDLNQ